MPRIERHTSPQTAPRASAATSARPAADPPQASPTAPVLAGTAYTAARPSAPASTADEVLRPLAERRHRAAPRAALDSAGPEPVPTPRTHPERFTADGQLKWKVPPPGAQVVPNTTGQGEWIEKWRNPRTGETVYNYTAKFMEQQALHKFRENARFGKTLPQIRQQLRADLAADGRERVLAAAVACIDEAYFRVGNSESAGDGVFGLTTLQARHLRFEGDKAIFDYVGKKKQPQHRVVEDPAAVAVLRELKAACASPEDKLFRDGSVSIDDEDVNKYLERFGVTAKQFRTYHATRLCREGLLALGSVPEAGREGAVAQVVKAVAEQLGHTPSVCRGSYIDPVVIEAFLQGKLR